MQWLADDGHHSGEEQRQQKRRDDLIERGAKDHDQRQKHAQRDHADHPLGLRIDRGAGRFHKTLPRQGGTAADQTGEPPIR
jgi:hypothetical protein